MFVPCPPPSLVQMWVPPCGDHEAEKSVQHVPSPSSHLSLTSVEEICEWLRKTNVNTYSSILQEDITIHNSSLESDLHLYHPPSSTVHESQYHESLDESISQLVVHILLILRLLAQILIRCNAITLHMQRRRKERILSISPLYFKIFYIKTISFHS